MNKKMQEQNFAFIFGWVTEKNEKLFNGKKFN